MNPRRVLYLVFFGLLVAAAVQQSWHLVGLAALSLFLFYKETKE